MRRTISLEAILYLAVGLLAAWLRFGHLDQPPLNDQEAAAALSASEAKFPAAQASVEAPAYRTLTAAAYLAAGEDEAPARTAPALAGLLAAFTPLLLRRRLGRAATLAAVLFLAISPTLWTASRTAGGASLAALGVVAVAFFVIRAAEGAGSNMQLAAAAGGLALASGPQGLTGLLTLAAGWGTLRFVGRRRSNPHAVGLPLPTGIGETDRLRALLTAGVVLLALATGLGLFPGGLREVFDGLGQWAANWLQRAGQPAGTVLLQLLAYEPLALTFGAFGAIAALRRGDGLELGLASWVVGALVVLLVYPSRQAADVLWLVVPLSMLAAPRLAGTLSELATARPTWVVMGAGSGALALLGFSYLQLRGYVSGPNAALEFAGVPALLGLALMGVLLAASALMLVAAGWSAALARRLAAGVGAVALLSMSVSAGAALNAAEPSPSELWREQTGTPGLVVLRESLSTLSEAELGRPRALPVMLGDRPSPSLAWVLRGHPRFSSLDPSVSPPVILVREGGALPGEYLGQSLSIGERRAWFGAYPPRLLAWWLTRAGPTEEQRWVLLVRQDVAGVEQLEQAE